MRNIGTIVYTADLGNTEYIDNAKGKGIQCYEAKDARSAVYMATGICAQHGKTTMVCMSGSNASRSAFSGMTEAYYRNLPVVLVTFGRELDYSRELADVVYCHYVVSNPSEIECFLDHRMPMHIEVDCTTGIPEKARCQKLGKLLEKALKEDDYLYISQSIQIDGNYRCKTKR